MGYYCLMVIYVRQVTALNVTDFLGAGHAIMDVTSLDMLGRGGIMNTEQRQVTTELIMCIYSLVT